MPRELVEARRVSIAGLRPWEYDAMDSDRYEEILHLQNALAQGLDRERARAKRIEQQRADLGKARADR